MNSPTPTGKIIIINGPSSSGKTTLALAVQSKFEIPFLRFSFDLFIENKVLPSDQIKKGIFNWAEIRPGVFKGLHRCLPALAGAGNNLIFDHIIETRIMLEDLLQSVAGLDVFFVSLHCSLPELERREYQRGNRHPGEARLDFETILQITSYDLELNSEDPLEDNTTILIKAWKNRHRPFALERMVSETSHGETPSVFTDY